MKEEQGKTYIATNVGVAVRGHGALKKVEGFVKLSTTMYQIIQHSAPVWNVSITNVHDTSNLLRAQTGVSSSTRCSVGVCSLGQDVISKEACAVLDKLQNTEPVEEGVDADAQHDRSQDRAIWDGHGTS